MGIAKEHYYLLMQLSKKREFAGGSVLQLGKQSGIVSLRQIRSICRSLQVSQPDFKIEDKYSFYRNYPTGDQLFSSLGFATIHSLDVHPYEGADFVGDLNKPLASFISEQYDLVFDGGTSEHVFNQFQVLENIFRFTKVGGLIIHATPANNFLDHGYVQQSPCFYWEYYLENGFELIEGLLTEHPRDFFRKRSIYQYEKLRYNDFSYGGHWNSRMLGNWFVFRKLATSSFGRIPQQARYTELFHETRTPQASKSQTYKLIRNFFRQHPLLKFLVLQMKHWSLKTAMIPKHFVRRMKPRPLFRI